MKLRFCPGCGERLGVGGRFCTGCGAALPTQETTTDSTAVIEQPPASTYAGTAAQAGPSANKWHDPVSRGDGWRGLEASQLIDRAKVGRERIAAGDWSGAVKAAGISLAVMFGYSLVVVTILVGVSGSSSLTAGQIVGLSAALTAMAAGGDLNLSGASGEILSDASVMFLPSTITLIGFSTLAFIFLRRLRTIGNVRLSDVAYQACRVAIAFVGFLLLVALIGRVQPEAGFGLTTGIPSTLFYGLIWLLTTLTIAVFWLADDVLPGRARSWRATIAPYAAGTAVLIVLGSVIMLLTAIILSLALPELDGAPFLVLLVAAPTILLALVAFGLGVPATLGGAGSFSEYGSGGLSTTVTVLDATEQDAWFWLLPVVTILVVVVSGVVAAACAPTPRDAQRHGWRFGIALGLLLAFGALNSGLSGGFTGFFGGTSEFHLEFILSVMLGLAWGAAAGWLGGQIAPQLPSALVAGLRRRLVRVGGDEPRHTDKPRPTDQA